MQCQSTPAPEQTTAQSSWHTPRRSVRTPRSHDQDPLRGQHHDTRSELSMQQLLEQAIAMADPNHLHSAIVKRLASESKQEATSKPLVQAPARDIYLLQQQNPLAVNAMSTGSPSNSQRLVKLLGDPIPREEQYRNISSSYSPPVPPRANPPSFSGLVSPAILHQHHPDLPPPRPPRSRRTSTYSSSRVSPRQLLSDSCEVAGISPPRFGFRPISPDNRNGTSSVEQPRAFGINTKACHGTGDVYANRIYAVPHRRFQPMPTVLECSDKPRCPPEHLSACRDANCQVYLGKAHNDGYSAPGGSQQVAGVLPDFDSNTHCFRTCATENAPCLMAGGYSQHPQNFQLTTMQGNGNVTHTAGAGTSRMYSRQSSDHQGERHSRNSGDHGSRRHRRRDHKRYHEPSDPSSTSTSTLSAGSLPQRETSIANIFPLRRQKYEPKLIPIFKTPICNWVKSIRYAIDPDDSGTYDPEYKRIIISRLPTEMAGWIRHMTLSEALDFLESMDAPNDTLQSVINTDYNKDILPSALYMMMCEDAKKSCPECTDPDFYKKFAFQLLYGKLSPALRQECRTLGISSFPSKAQLQTLDKAFRELKEERTPSPRVSAVSCLNSTAASDEKKDAGVESTLLSQVAATLEQIRTATRDLEIRSRRTPVALVQPTNPYDFPQGSQGYYQPPAQNSWVPNNNRPPNNNNSGGQRQRNAAPNQQARSGNANNGGGQGNRNVPNKPRNQEQNRQVPKDNNQGQGGSPNAQQTIPRTPIFPGDRYCSFHSIFGPAAFRCLKDNCWFVVDLNNGCLPDPIIDETTSPRVREALQEIGFQIPN